jgi:hypothetical protein
VVGIPGRDAPLVDLRHGARGALLTAIYMTRMMLYTFHGRTAAARRSSRTSRKRRGS